MNHLGVEGPGGEQWQVYTVLADAGAELEGKTTAELELTPAAARGGDCCGTAQSETGAATTAACCAN